MAELPHRTLSAPRRDTFFCGVVALLYYGLLRQQTLYSVDAHGFLLQAGKAGVGMHPNHFSYLPLLALCREVSRVTGTSLYTCAVWLSAIGAAIGILFVHAANRRLALSRASALWATAFAATVPALVFYATVVEVHAQHFALCGAAFLATANFAMRPAIRSGLWLGLATGIGYLGHATGAMLPAMTVPVAVALARGNGYGWRACRSGLGVALVVHAGMLFGTPWVLRGLGFAATTGSASALLRMHVLGLCADPLQVFDAAWRDWLRPFAPVAALGLLALAVARTRPLAIALLATSLVYCVITAALLVPFVDRVQVSGHGTERGAYLLPLAWPAGLLAALLSRHRLLLALCLVVGIGIGAFDVLQHDQRPQRAFANGFHELCSGRTTYCLVGGHEELAAFLVDLPDQVPDRDWQTPVLLLDVPEQQLAAASQVFAQWLRAKCVSGVEVWLTSGCVDTLTLPGWTKGRPAAAQLLQELHADFRWEEHRAQGFVGWRLVPR